MNCVTVYDLPYFEKSELKVRHLFPRLSDDIVHGEKPYVIKHLTFSDILESEAVVQAFLNGLDTLSLNGDLYRNFGSARAVIPDKSGWLGRKFDKLFFPKVYRLETDQLFRRYSNLYKDPPFVHSTTVPEARELVERACKLRNQKRKADPASLTIRVIEAYDSYLKKAEVA